MEIDLILLAAGGAVLCTLLAGLGIWIFMRKRYIRFSNEVCASIDQILEGKEMSGFDFEEEKLLSKIQLRLKRLSEITAFAARDSEKQKKQVQSIVSDISHQLKTPIANITMYCDTATNPGLPQDMREQCLETLKHQVEKLDLLIQSLISMSRLENNIITLQPEINDVRVMLCEVAENVCLPAQKKQIELLVEYPEKFCLYYDEKWTSEAVFNIVENAVKYTNPGGRIRIYTEKLDIYSKIVIEDNGAGIAPEHINDVCKRFFREEKSRKEEGVGIGLYLAREIVMKQNGYLKIWSEEGKGTIVSVYLLNEKK